MQLKRCLVLGALMTMAWIPAQAKCVATTDEAVLSCGSDRLVVFGIGNDTVVDGWRACLEHRDHLDESGWEPNKTEPLPSISWSQMSNECQSIRSYLENRATAMMGSDDWKDKVKDAVKSIEDTVRGETWEVR